MSWKSLSFVLSLSLFAVGCKTEYKGRMDVFETLTPVVKKGNKTLAPGSYDATLTIKNEDMAEIEVSVAGRNNNPVLPFRLRGADLPRENGPIYIASSVSGQPYDLRGELSTIRTQGPLRRGNESCTEQVPERVCWRDRSGRVICETRWRTVYGTQNIEYYDLFTDTRVNASLEDPRAHQELARLSAADSSAERMVTYRSHCHWY